MINLGIGISQCRKIVARVGLPHESAAEFVGLMAETC